MALDFNNKIPEWKNKGTEPTDELKEKGFTGGYKPPATVFNWFWSLVQKCISELQTVVKSHADNTDNPHGVTKAQLGLGNVDNTADINKEVLSASKLTNAVKINNTAFDGTKDIDISANPTRTALTGSPDLNTILQQGEYYAPYGNTCDNKPKYVRSFALKVYWNMVGSSTTVTQVLFPSHVSIKGYCYIRKSDSTGWSDWKEVCVEGHSHTKSEITDFNIPNFLDTQEGSENVDLNNLTTQGIYCNISGVEYVNAPVTKRTPQGATAGYSFALVVLTSRTASNHSGGYVTQIYYDTWGYAGSYSKMYVRTKNGNNWSDWCSYYNTNNKPTLEDIVGSTVLPVSKGGTGFSTISAGYALVGNGTSAQLDTRYIRSDVAQSSSDLVTSGAVYTALNAKADKEKLSELEESLSYTDESIAGLKETLNKTCYLVGAKDSDANLLMYCDVKCTGISDNIAIQELIDTVPEGSEIKFLAGNYNLKDSLKINKSLSLIGSGLNTVFTATYLSSSKVLTDTSIFWINSIGADNIVENIQISNLKISKGLCRLDGKYIAGDGTEFSSEYPGYTDSTRGALVAGNVIKLKLDSVQFENKLTTGSTSMIRCTGSTTKIWTIYLRDCFHTNNSSFNGYFIDTGAGSFDTNFTTLTLALSGCDSTGSLCINLPAKENKDKVLDNSFNVKYYIKGAEE